jgi:hypothetical protein
MRIIGTRLILAATVVTAGLFAGCNRDEQANRTPPPGKAPAVPAPVEVPTPATKPVEHAAVAPSYLFIKKVPPPAGAAQSQSQAQPSTDENPNDMGPSVAFAAARLAFTGKGGHGLVAVLFSDDPKEALKDNWTGDRYKFRMPLLITDRSQIDGRPYRMERPFDSSEEDTQEGIFFHGDDVHLEPIDLDVRFEMDNGKVLVKMGGLFKQVDPNRGEVQWYHVRGVLRATMD